MTDSTSSPLVLLADVSWGFDEGGTLHPVLDGVDLELSQGELVVLLGRSGSGKSTLLNLVGGLERPTSGRILSAEWDLADLPETERTLYRRRQVGFVFQFFNLVPTLTVLENLLLPLELNGRLDRKTRTRARDLLAEVGLGDREDSFPDVLSGGEQQRVAVARALVHDPPLVLADEPTGNLDQETGREVLGLLDRLTRQAGKTLLMATHSREVAAIADRVFTLQAGRLVRTSPSEL